MRNYLKVVILNAIILMLIAILVTGCSKSGKTSSASSSTTNYTKVAQGGQDEPTGENAVQPNEAAPCKNDKPVPSIHLSPPLPR